MNPAFYYNYHLLGDVMLIILDGDARVDSWDQHDSVIALYHQGRLVGYNILGLSKIMKLKAQGRLPILPLPALSIINDHLINHDFAPLEVKDGSGFQVAKVLRQDGDQVQLDKGDMTVTLTEKASLQMGSRVVICEHDTLLFNGNSVKSKTPDLYYICRGIDLGEDDPSIVVIEEDIPIGSDLFGRK